MPRSRSFSSLVVADPEGRKENQMAGKPISRMYEDRIFAYGVEKIYDRVENGETIKAIALDLGMSRGWLSTYLNHDDSAAELLALCRAKAALRCT